MSRHSKSRVCLNRRPKVNQLQNNHAHFLRYSPLMEMDLTKIYLRGHHLHHLRHTLPQLYSKTVHLLMFGFQTSVTALP